MVVADVVDTAPVLRGVLFQYAHREFRLRLQFFKLLSVHIPPQNGISLSVAGGSGSRKLFSYSSNSSAVNNSRSTRSKDACASGRSYGLTSHASSWSVSSAMMAG